MMARPAARGVPVMIRVTLRENRDGREYLGVK
jgi:hypothetical protein